MKFKGTAGMMVVFLILGAYYFFVDLPAEKKKAHENEIAGKVLAFKKENIKELSLFKQNQTIILLQNNGKKWHLAEPLKAAGDIPVVEGFLSNLNNLEKLRVVDSKPENLSQYGLEPPSFKIHLQFKEGKEETLLLGDDSPIGGSVYLKLESDPGVILATTSKANFDKSVYDFRDKTIFNFSTASINRIQIKRKDETANLIKEKEQWKVSGKVKAKADKDAILNFLQTIQFSRIKGFESENPESLKNYGLDIPYATLTLEDENKKSYVIDLGSSKNGSGYYGKKNESQEVFVVDTKFYNTIKKQNIDFLNKTLIDFKDKDVMEIKIQNEEETIQAIRIDKENWEIKKPQETTADMATINSYLLDLKEAKISKFVSLSQDATNSFGLDKPKRSFSITTVNGEPQKIFFGENSLDGNHFYAQRAGESIIFLVAKETKKKLFRTFHELRNKKLLKFKTVEINKIVIETQQALFELKKSNSRWKLLKPEKIKIKEFIGNDILWTLQGIEFDSFKETNSIPSFSGLTSPAFKLSIWKNNSEKSVELKVGNLGPNGQKYFAKIEDKMGYYLIKKKFLDSIPLNLERFKS